MKRRLFIAAVVMIGAASLVNASSVQHSAPKAKPSAKATVGSSMILLRAKPSNTARVIARFKLGTHLVAFYKKGDWYKAGDPQTGEVGWYNQHQVARAMQSQLNAPMVEVRDYSVTINKQGDKPAKVTAYRNGKKLSDKQAQAFYQSLQQRAKKQGMLWQQQMNVMQGQIGQMQQMDASLFNGFDTPIVQPVIIIEKPGQAAQPAKKN